mgnify:CR=1 FL=1
MFGFATTPAHRAGARPTVRPMQPAEAIRLAAAGEITLVDVRDIAEIRATGRAKGAVHAPLFRLAHLADPRHPDHLAALDPARPVALYCASGARSQMAGETLLRLGYAAVHNIGGLEGWRAAGGPVTA